MKLINCHLLVLHVVRFELLINRWLLLLFASLDIGRCFIDKRDCVINIFEWGRFVIIYSLVHLFGIEIEPFSAVVLHFVII